jgi:hypothetical protein
MQPKTKKKDTTMQKTHTPTMKNKFDLPWSDNGEGLIYGQCADDADEAPFICDCAKEGG